MAGIEQPQYTVNVSQENLINKFAVQGEENSRVLTLHLVENVSTENALQQTEIRQKPLDLTGCTARLYTKKPDGNATFINGTIVANGADGNPNTVTFVLTQQTTAAAGNAHCTVAIFGSNGTELKATGITLDIAADDMEQTIVSTSEFVSLAEALGSVQESEQKATQAVSDSQKAVTDAQSAITEINNTEQSVKTAESSRVTAESSRATAEQTREANESTRQANETARQTAETQRQTDTATAITNANAAADLANHVPQYGDNGNWESWNGTAYADSGKPWKGEKGGTGLPFQYGESYETLTALQSAYPSGDTKGHFVAGELYLWDSTAWYKWPSAMASQTITTTLLATNWVGDAAPYSYDLSVSGVSDSSIQEILPVVNATYEQIGVLCAAEIVDAGQSTGHILLAAHGYVPTIDLPVRVILRG